MDLDHQQQSGTVSEYASPQRSGKQEVQRQRDLLSTHYAPLYQLLDAVSEVVLIVNENRQIVFFNQHVPQLLGRDAETLYGLRPGEALGCMHECTSPGRCGTSKFCSECGAVNAILTALADKRDVKECRIQQTTGDAFDLLVKTTPLKIEGENFCIVAITDISHEKRRRMLERLFFHDILNTAASIQIMSGLIRDNSQTKDIAEYKQHIMSASKQLIEEIRSQKEFLAAETNELKPSLRMVDAARVCDELFVQFSKNAHDQRINLSFAHASENTPIKTDPSLLKRVLANMLKNALEASQSGQTVTFSFTESNSVIEFAVHNPAYIPQDIQLQIFQRSFSTKGSGRGLGTYSMKLLSERYLNGRVDFESSEENGTTFYARYPLSI